MYNKIPYKLKFLSLYLVSVLFIIFSVYYTFEQFSKNDINNISIENIKKINKEKNIFFNDFFNQYIITLKALQEDSLLNAYIDDQIEVDKVESLFLTIKKSLPCAMQVRYIDNNGYEKVRVEGTPIKLFGDNSISTITSKPKLQNKKNREYFKKFIILEKDEVGISKIDLNKENGKIEKEKKPVVRFGVTVFDKKAQKKGVLVINICLKTFFKTLSQSALYNVYLIDKKGRFIIHHDLRYGLEKENFNKHTIVEHYGEKKAKDILLKKTYIDNRLYSAPLNFNNNQNLKLILELKFDKFRQENIDNSNYIIYFMVFIAIILFPMVLHFAKLPDFLKSEIENNTNKHKNTNLPNRISLIKDLENGKFTNSLVVLVKVKNMTKIQNLYGYKVGEQLIVELAEYLQSYPDENIKERYIISYGTFSLQYNNFRKSDIDLFLSTLLNKIESKHFCVKQDIDLLLDIAISCSDISNNKTGVLKLKEAEIALENGVEQKIDISIYSTKYIKKLKKNKDNIEIGKKIQYAIENDTIEVHFQPIFSNYRDKIEKYESLIRLKYHDEYIFPDQFLPIAKDLNKYKTLTYMVINKSFKFFQDKDFEFSINISMLDIENENFIDFLLERIDYYDVSKKLVLEIVESESVEDYKSFYKFIKSVKKVGCKVAIDDFGSGYSNFEHLLKLSDHIDYLKIDGSLVKNITTDSKIQILVGSLKFLCDNLRVETIAEYVEDSKTQEYINSIGIDYSQGYLIGKPSKDLI